MINIPKRVIQTSATILDSIITKENRHEILPVVIDYAIGWSEKKFFFKIEKSIVQNPDKYSKTSKKISFGGLPSLGG